MNETSTMYRTSLISADLGYSSVSGMPSVPSSVKYQGLILQICNLLMLELEREPSFVREMDLLITEIKWGGGETKEHKKKNGKPKGQRTPLVQIHQSYFKYNGYFMFNHPKRNPT